MLRRYGTNTASEDEDYDDSDAPPFEPMEFWGTVNKVLKGAEENLPEEDNTRVVRLATAMLIFFIVCIILLLVYLACSVMLMYGSAKNSRVGVVAVAEAVVVSVR